MVVALGPCSQSAPLLGPEVGGGAFREAVSLDRPQDLPPHVGILSPCPMPPPSALARSCPTGLPGPPATSSDYMALPGFPGGGRACPGSPTEGETGGDEA